MAKKIMILGAGIYQKPLLEYASQHYEVIVVAPEVDDMVSRLVTKHYQYDIRDQERILTAAQQECINGIITDQTDIPVRTIAYVAERMRLPGNPYEVACVYTDKALMRKRQIEAGISVLPNKTVDSLEEAIEWYRDLGSDMIIKPLDNQGSRGVAAIRGEKDLRMKYGETARYSSSGKVLCEKMATGRQFAVEGIALGGKYRSIMCSDDYYFSVGDCFAAKARVFNTVAPCELRERVLAMNDKINKSFGLWQGLSHAEYIMDGDNIYLIEVGARGGGAYISSDIIPRVSGLNTAEFLCKLALGEITEFPDLMATGDTVGYMAFYLPEGIVRSIEGIADVIALPYVYRNTLSTIKLGKCFGRAEDKTSRQLLVVGAKDREMWNERTEKIKKMLNIKIETCNGDLLSPIWS